MSYIAEIEHRVAGIPCLIGVTHYESVRGSYSYNAPSDMDYYGYTEAEWEILDRRGRKAPWLERKVTAKDTASIEEAISNALED
jgi:hypothetical protein